MVINLAEAIEYAYAATDTFEGTRFSYTLQSADIATLGELYSATAVYTAGGVTRTHKSAYDVVLHPLENPLTFAGIKSRWPDISQQEFEEQRGEDYARQRDDAWEIVKRDLRRQGKRPALLITGEDLEDWAYAVLALYLTEAGVKVLRGPEAFEALEYWREKVTLEKNDALASLKWHDDDEDEALGAAESEGVRLDFYR